MTPIAANETQLEKGIFVHITQRLLGVRRKVNTSQIEVKGDDQVDKRLLNVTKAILECEEYDAIVKGQAELRNFLRARAIWMPWHKAGYYFVALANASEVLEGIEERTKKETANVELFVKALTKAKAAAKTRLGKLYNEADYPSEWRIRRGIGTELEIRDEVVPERLKNLDADIFKEELKKKKAEAQELVREFKYDLRRQLQELVAHLADRLAPDAQGERKVFRTSALENINEWLAFFDDKNTVTQDGSLGAEVDKLRKLLSGVDVDQLKDDEKFRKQLTKDVDGVKKSLDGLIKEAPKRLIADRDEEV